MSLDSNKLAQVISEETGFIFDADSGIDSEGRRFYLLRPHQESASHTFAIRTTLDWRRLLISFEPDTFAGELLAAMGRADNSGQVRFVAVLDDCREYGAEIDLRVNDERYQIDQNDIWVHGWRRFSLTLKTGHLHPETADGEPDAEIICRWTGRFTAAIIAILPVEQADDESERDIIGYPEGATMSVKTNRYERDRRNRAAAIAIHGTSCFGCGINMGKMYGPAAEGFIEIHHTKPVSQLGPGYVINPNLDLVPLCPNCHATVHRRNPPFSVDEIRELLKSSAFPTPDLHDKRT